MSHQPGVLVKDVADSLCIHPFMLSKWRKQVRDGVLKGRAAPVEPAAVAELQRLREVELKPAWCSMPRIGSVHPGKAAEFTGKTVRPCP
jgi:transposase-like protein